MSFNDVFHDYITDVPMQMSRKFYPTQNIKVDLIQIPDRLTFSKFDYSFEAENRARDQFDKQNETIVLDSSVTSSTGATSSQRSEAVKSSESGNNYQNFLSKNVLVPCPVNSTPSMSSNTKPITPNTVSLPHSLQDFESTKNVFDDVQILALDDRKALQEVLMLTNSTSAQRESGSSSPKNAPINNNNHVKSMPSPPQKPEKSAGKDHEELKKRLLTKGYRQDIVEKALDSLPKNRLVHIEYYMKACRTIEKTGKCTVEKSLPFLIDCNLSDKMVILTYSDVCANLLKMGFPSDSIFDAVAAEKGDQNGALNRLLPNS